MINLTDTAELKEKDRLHHFHPQTNPVQFAKDGPTLIDRAEGIYIYDECGKKIIDGMSGGWCTNIGYGNERLCKAAFETMKTLSYGLVFGGRTNRWAAALSDKLAAITPESFQHFFYASTGSDAVESSIKMALYYWRQRGQTGKRIILSRRHSYHGLTIVANSLTGIDSLHTQFGLPLTDIVQHVDAPFWYRYGRHQSPDEFGLSAAASLERKIIEVGPENIAAFIGEPIQATGNMVFPPDTYWPEVRRICDQYDILLIADEVVTGFGKTGHMFGFQALGFEPDIFVMAKGISSGYFPISAVAIGAKVAEILQNSDEVYAHGFTNCGHPVGAAVALENIAVIEEEGLLDKVKNDIGPYLAERLADFMDLPCVGEVRSIGIMCGIEVDVQNMHDASRPSTEALVKKIGNIAWEKGLNARPVGTAVGMVLPMIVTRAQLDDATTILKSAFIEALG